MHKKQRIVRGQGASNKNYSIVVFSFDVCRLSPLLTILNCLFAFPDCAGKILKER